MELSNDLENKENPYHNIANIQAHRIYLSVSWLLA